MTLAELRAQITKLEAELTRETAADGASACDPIPDPSSDDMPEPRQICLANARIAYLSDLIKCTGVEGCCVDAEAVYYAAIENCGA